MLSGGRKCVAAKRSDSFSCLMKPLLDENRRLHQLRPQSITSSARRAVRHVHVFSLLLGSIWVQLGPFLTLPDLTAT